MNYIDRQIVETVMGWKNIRTFPANEVEGEHYLYKDGGHTMKMIPHDFSPSTNIAHAFEAEAKVFELGYTMEICRTASRDFMVFVYAVGRSPLDPPLFSKRHKHPEMAICLAALEAVKGEQ